MAPLIRPAREDDLAACYEVWLSTETDRAAPGSVAPGTVLPLHEHELHSGTLLVAEAAGEIVGFGATCTRSDVLYLADLFVRPDTQGAGVGRALLHRLLDDAPAQRFTFASSDPSARSLYAKFGMDEHWTLGYLEASSGALPFDVDVLDADGMTAIPATVDDVLAIDHQVTGRDRRVDLEHERDRLGFSCFVLRRGDASPLGYGVVIHPQWWVPWKPHGTRVAPVMVLDAQDACAAVAATMRAALALGATDITTFVPSVHPAREMLLTAGFVETDTDAYMASDPALIDGSRYLPPIDVP
jgi:GNAT superfamily N-acetyltransferase